MRGLFFSGTLLAPLLPLPLPLKQTTSRSSLSSTSRQNRTNQPKATHETHTTHPSTPTKHNGQTKVRPAINHTQTSSSTGNKKPTRTHNALRHNWPLAPVIDALSFAPSLHCLPSLTLRTLPIRYSPHHLHHMPHHDTINTTTRLEIPTDHGLNGPRYPFSPILFSRNVCAVAVSFLRDTRSSVTDFSRSLKTFVLFQ